MASQPVIARYSVTIAASATTENATITAVPDITKTYVRMTHRVGGTSNSPNSALVSIQLIDTTTVRLQRVGTTGEVTVEFEVVYHATGVTVQRGSLDMAGLTTGNETLTAVDLTKAWAMITWRRTGTSFDLDDIYRAELTSTTNLAVTVNAAPGGTATVEWQVVEYDNCTVQQVSGTILSTETTHDEAITAVDLTKTIVFSSVDGMIGAIREIGIHYLSSTTNVRSDRNATGSVALNFTHFVVEFSDAVTVQHGQKTLADASASGTETITSVDTAKAVTYTTGSDFSIGVNVGAADEFDDACVTTVLTDATTLTFTRGGTTGANMTAWSVAEWDIVTPPDPTPGGGATYFRRRNAFQMCGARI